jgi:hypothetical protein
VVVQKVRPRHQEPTYQILIFCTMKPSHTRDLEQHTRSYIIASAMARVLRISGLWAISEEPDAWDMQRIDINSQHGNPAVDRALQLVIFCFSSPSERTQKTEQEHFGERDNFRSWQGTEGTGRVPSQAYHCVGNFRCDLFLDVPPKTRI